MTIAHELQIAAPVERVWELTVDVERWPQLSPTTMTSVERCENGPLRVGSSARVKQPRQRSTVWTVDTIEPHHRFVWSAKVLGVSMTASHLLTPVGEGCLNRLEIETSGFAGRLVELIGGRSIRRAITIENEAFKRAAEVTSSNR